MPELNRGADTFIDATGGGWGKVPESINPDDGEQAMFVAQTLERAREYAENNIRVGQEFDFIITDIPMGIDNPHEIIARLTMKANEHGLMLVIAHDETVRFTFMG